MRPTRLVIAAVVVCLATAAVVAQQPAAISANSDPTYQQLRRITVGGERITVNEFVLKRDAAKFVFHSGTFTLLAPVNGKVTGAVFSGSGILTLSPPVGMENQVLSLLTGGKEFVESFDKLVLRFTDDTAAEIQKAGTAPQGAAGDAASQLDDSQKACRFKLHYNLNARILNDVLENGQGGLFWAFIHGTRYSGKMLYTVDPYGAEDVAPEEISLRTYDDMKMGIWAAFHYSAEYGSGQATGTQQNRLVRAQHHKLEAQIEKSGNLRGTATSTLVAGPGGVRVVPLNLYPTLRVSKVSDAQGHALSFIQEDKNEDPDYWVILPANVAAGGSLNLTTEYEGKDAIRNTGGGNYFPVAREDWYPSTNFGDYATYELKFSIPKSLQMVATGTPVSNKTEGDQNVTEWRSDQPMAVAGFNFGSFKEQDAKVENPPYTVQSFANREAPDFVRAIRDNPMGSLAGGPNAIQPQAMTALGSMNTTTMMQKPLAEAQLAVGLYATYFGAGSYDRIAMTQQTACNFGQSWPELVFLPICSYFDDTVKHELGLTDLRGYWRIVAPHEVAHQWWGHTVGFASYRDQWMSEGFSDFSASLFVQMIEKNPQEFIRFWDDERELLTESNKEGHRAIDVGPVVLGYRLANSRAGFDIPRRLIYPKGAYILHMIRMMMWDPKKGDAAFQAMMKDFVQTYRNRAASTEDFKAVVEKHMLPSMDLQGNQRMDWFFNEYVYGTALPSYKVDYSFQPDPQGMRITVSVTQSNVDDNFDMVVPVYLELAGGRVTRLGQFRIKGNASQGIKDVLLSGLKEPPKRAMVNYYDDVLASK